MKRTLLALTLLLLPLAAQAGDACSDKVDAVILAHDRAARQGMGFLLNYCGRPVSLDLIVIALNRDGFPVGRGRALVQSSNSATLSVVAVDLPFVQSRIELSGFVTVVQSATAVGEPPRTASTSDDSTAVAARDRR